MNSLKISFDSLEAEQDFLNALMGMSMKCGMHIEVLAEAQQSHTDKSDTMTVAEALDQFPDYSSPEQEVTMPPEPQNLERLPPIREDLIVTCNCVVKKTDMPGMLLLFPRRLCPVHGQYWKI